MAQALSESTRLTAGIRPGEVSGMVSLVGHWTLSCLDNLEDLVDDYEWPRGSALILDASPIVALDTAGAWLLHRTRMRLAKSGIDVSLCGLGNAHAALLDMVAGQEMDLRSARAAEEGALTRIGRVTWEGLTQSLEFLAFTGETTLVLLRSLAHPGRIRWSALWQNVQRSGFDALPIAGLLSFLMGMVIAYQGAVQLGRYGANIFIVDLVGLSLLRELAPLLTAIIIAGRSGSAYTAEIGTMNITEEVDALRTIGIAPIELLVLPKILGLMIALPLLTVYADLMGLFGGMVIASSQLAVSFTDFINRLDEAVSLTSFMIGVGKAPVFAGMIALVGCFQGFRVHGSADSVGRHTTISVVQSIFLVIVIDALFSVAYSNLGI
jgi:phospholipid/cholesterol/gamma-HCH transport system permease protein